MIRFSHDPDASPAVLHHPASLGARVGPAVLLYGDGPAWLVTPDASHHLPDPVRSVQPGRRTIVVEGPEQTTRIEVDTLQARTGPTARWRPAEHTELALHDGRWVVHAGTAQLPPVAATVDIRPLPSGDGVVWRDGGTLYLGRPSGVRAVCRSAGEWVAGPGGSLLLGDGHRWTRAGLPGRTPRPLSEALLTDLPVRWSPDGRAVAGYSATRCEVVRHDLDTGSSRVLGVSDATLFDAETACHGLPGFGGSGLALPGRAAACARAGPLLAGPGGVTWDLTRARPLFTEPVYGDGATVAVPDAPWATVTRDGRGQHVDPTTGTVHGHFAVPLAEDEAVVGGRWRDGIRLVADSGRTFRVDGERAVLGAPRRPPLPAPRRVAGVLVEGAATVEGRRFGWSRSGLLVVGPPLSRHTPR